MSDAQWHVLGLLLILGFLVALGNDTFKSKVVLAKSYIVGIIPTSSKN